MAARVVTLTLNPAIDIACSAERVRHTHKVRTGGGGINVARVLHARGALKWGVAAGTATVLCAGAARLTAAEVEAQYRRLPG